jgi:hypothetical protein
MMRELAKWSFEGKTKSVVELEDYAEQTIDLGSWQVTVTFGAARKSAVPANAKPISKAMIVQLSENVLALNRQCCILR